MRSTHRGLALLAAGALLLAACGDDDQAESTTELAVAGTDDLTFEPDEFTVPAGQEVTVELTSQAVEHDLVIEDASEVGHVGGEGHGDHGEDEHDEDHAEGEHDLHVAHADPNETVTATFQIDEPGTYEVYCSVPGHREAGMTATLEVVDAS
jgi:uncharacterized cupredoxin-like copper-binding protein